MADLIVVGFDNAEDAFKLRDELVQAQKEYLVELADAVVVTRPSEGEYQLHQGVNLTAAGALGGTFWGGLVGLIFLNPLLGAAVGAASGALAGSLTDYGIDDDFIRGIGKTLPQGGAAVFLLARKLNLDKLDERIGGFSGGARIIQTSLSDADEARLRDALAEQAQSVIRTAPAAGASATKGAGMKAHQIHHGEVEPDSDVEPAVPTSPPRL
ncbi:MAG: hypothetical protein DI498_05785 [Paracoccus denitrificans]|nr:MAG: hypothetical protein DI498_05785 [Paracoccus denitrificans]PZO84939.1 MAG: hypothetical protein DI633_05785 [Paracoccus denitrificans]